VKANKSPTCKHCKIPLYTPEEFNKTIELNKRIDGGDASAYIELTKSALSVAIDDNRFTREECPQCS